MRYIVFFLQRCRRLLCGMLISIIAVTVLTGCEVKFPRESFSDDSKLHVVTSIFVGYDFARQISGEDAEIMLLLKPGSEAHSFEPTPADIIAIEKCDVFICTGGENDAWVEEILESIDNPELRIIRMTECVGNLLEEEESEGMQGEGGFLAHEEEEEAEWDEHVWMDIDNAKLICEAIERTFAELKPEYAEKLEKRLAEYCTELDMIDNMLWTTVLSSNGNEVVFADRFPARYFTERYGITYYAAFPGCSENTEASAATVSFLIDKVREDDLPLVFKTELSAGKLASVVSEETGAAVGTFYTGHNVSAEDFEAGITFADMMIKNAQVLSFALQ